MFFRIVVLSLALSFGIGALIPMTTHYSEASAAKTGNLKRKNKKYKKYTKKWWREYRHRVRRKKALEARKRTLRLRRIRLENAKKALTQPADQKANAFPAILVNDLFLLIEGKIKDVFDGETFNVEARDGKFYLVGMLGVDAPEMDRDFGDKSQENLSNLILGKEATIIIRKRDLSGRYLGTVYSGGEDINLLQIKRGMARYFRQNGYEPSGGDRKLYEQAEQKARIKRNGLWGVQKNNNSLALKR